MTNVNGNTTVAEEESMVSSTVVGDISTIQTRVRENYLVTDAPYQSSSLHKNTTSDIVTFRVPHIHISSKAFYVCYSRARSNN